MVSCGGKRIKYNRVVNHRNLVISILVIRYKGKPWCFRRWGISALVSFLFQSKRFYSASVRNLRLALDAGCYIETATLSYLPSEYELITGYKRIFGNKRVVAGLSMNESRKTGKKIRTWLEVSSLCFSPATSLVVCRCKLFWCVLKLNNLRSTLLFFSHLCVTTLVSLLVPTRSTL